MSCGSEGPESRSREAESPAPYGSEADLRGAGGGGDMQKVK